MREIIVCRRPLFGEVIKTMKNLGKRMGTCVFALTILALSMQASANSIVGVIHTIHVNTDTRMVHVQLNGLPQFDGGGCSIYWTGNSMDNLEFKNFVYPILLSAQATKQQVSIWVNGCNGIYPRIAGIDIVPRQ